MLAAIATPPRARPPSPPHPTRDDDVSVNEAWAVVYSTAGGLILAVRCNPLFHCCKLASADEGIHSFRSAPNTAQTPGMTWPKRYSTLDDGQHLAFPPLL